MISEAAQEAFVWCWLPDAEEPVIAGRLEPASDLVLFNYGLSYLGRSDAIPLYLPELPLRRGSIEPRPGLYIAGCIDDASPDAWGKRVIMQALLGSAAKDTDPAALDRLTYLLRSGADRIGALDFQDTPDVYVPRLENTATLEELMEAADRVDRGLPLSPALDRALLHGSSVGGARPKALLDDDETGGKLIAKFSASGDIYPVVQGEFCAMELARRAGLDVATVRLKDVLGRWALLVERFDRVPGTRRRRAMVSALTMLELDELMGRYATYADLAELIRARFTDAQATLHELFSRIVFNILVGNNDDHARNHAAFWNGETLRLTPAYDISPGPRSAGEVTQAMAIGPDGYRYSKVAGCVRYAGTYSLSEREARAIVDHQLEVINAEWSDVAEFAELTELERDYFWHRQFLNPYALEGYA
ncbi:MAG: type II toxin-antitoxin system HipA family toxin [Solirubrobacteraceae bacterium]